MNALIRGCRMQQRRLSDYPYVLGAFGAVIIMIFSFINGYALLYNDSRQYVHGPALVLKFATGIDLTRGWPEREVIQQGGDSATDSASQIPLNRPYSANRSIYYGALAFLGYQLSNFWLTIFIQAYFVAVAIALLILRCLKLSYKLYFTIILVLSLLTPLAVFCSLIMPDIFAGVLILGAALLLIYWNKLTMIDKYFLTAVTTFAVLSHPSHILILLAIIAFALVLRFAGAAPRTGYAPIAASLAALVLGVLGFVAYDKGLERATGHKTIVMPHIMAGLIDKGPGYAYLVANCPKANFVICKYEDRLPQTVDDFMGADPKNGVFASADLATQIKLSEEQYRFALTVLAYDPLGVTIGLLRDGLKQTVLFPVDDLRVTPQAMQNFKADLPAGVVSRIANSAFARDPYVADIVTMASYGAAILSVVFLTLFLLETAKRSGPASKLLGAFNWVVIFGVLSNALICGAINTPIDRYQARVIWLLPLLALVDLAYRQAISRAARLSGRATLESGEALESVADASPAGRVGSGVR
jgi:hypothetical protein